VATPGESPCIVAGLLVELDGSHSLATNKRRLRSTTIRVHGMAISPDSRILEGGLNGPRVFAQSVRIGASIGVEI